MIFPIFSAAFVRCSACGRYDPRLWSCNTTGPQPNGQNYNRYSFVGMSGGADGKGINYGLISADKTMKILWDFVADETVRGQIRNLSWFDKERKTRVAVTKMRISYHLLPIESGRYKKIPRVQRFCLLCNRSEIGDEFYYLLKCNHLPLFHIRGTFLESLYSINSNFTNMS